MTTNLDQIKSFAPRHQAHNDKHWPSFSDLGLFFGVILLTTLSPSKGAFAARPVEYPFDRSVIFSFTTLFHGASPVEYRFGKQLELGRVGISQGGSPSVRLPRRKFTETF